ncbi:hypothetical protein BC567DRAFT_223340 [Phyllosticta citribraziliensis]
MAMKKRKTEKNEKERLRLGEEMGDQVYLLRLRLDFPHKEIARPASRPFIDASRMWPSFARVVGVGERKRTLLLLEAPHKTHNICLSCSRREQHVYLGTKGIGKYGVFDRPRRLLHGSLRRRTARSICGAGRTSALFRQLRTLWAHRTTAIWQAAWKLSQGDHHCRQPRAPQCQKRLFAARTAS